MDKNKTWYKVNVVPKQNATSEAEIHIFDEIGFFGIDAGQFKEDFDKIKDLSSIKLLLNSPGGSVFDGVAIYNMLTGFKGKVTVEVEGIAASIASVIAMAGEEIIMREGTFMMIHNPWTFMVGDADELRKEANVLDKIKDQIITIYQNKSEMNAEDIEALMRDETWMTPTEAKAMGFATSVTEAPKVAASFNKSISDFGFNNIPQSQVPINYIYTASTNTTNDFNYDYLGVKGELEDIENEQEKEKELLDSLQDKIKTRILQLKIQKLKNGNDTKSSR